MAATVSQVRGVGLADPVLIAATTDAIEAVLVEAALHMSERSWAERYTIGHALLAAHLLVDSSRGATSSPVKGPVVSESLGPASRVYAQSLVKVQNDTLNLNGTTYGRRYLALREHLVVHPLGIYEGGDFPTGEL